MRCMCVCQSTGGVILNSYYVYPFQSHYKTYHCTIVSWFDPRREPPAEGVCILPPPPPHGHAYHHQVHKEIKLLSTDFGASSLNRILYTTTTHEKCQPYHRIKNEEFYNISTILRKICVSQAMACTDFPRKNAHQWYSTMTHNSYSGKAKWQ